jgi:NAD-dependent deacetylase
VADDSGEHLNYGGSKTLDDAMAKQEQKASDREILDAARMIIEAQYPISLTGAGMSVESGIPPFRGPGGLWTKYGEPPMNGYQIFLADPKKGWEDRIRRQDDELWRPLKMAEPNPGHRALAELEEIGVLRFLITQNVDDLHRQAGHQNLAEIHGNWKLIRCIECGARFKSEEISLNTLPPPCPRCQGILKGDTVSFGEPIPRDVLQQCMEHSARSDLVIVAGTSATVYPAAGFALEVKERGGALIEANLYESEITPICDVSLRGPTGEVLPRLTAAVSELRKSKMS